MTQVALKGVFKLLSNQIPVIYYLMQDTTGKN